MQVQGTKSEDSLSYPIDEQRRNCAKGAAITVKVL